MALRNPSLFLYNFEINGNNRYISFRAVPAETPRVATLREGFYSLSGLATEIERALSAQDTANTYTMSVNRGIAAGLENRVTIATSGSTLELLFASGNPSNPATLLGFTATDKTGATTYTGSSTAGTALVPNQLGFSYLPPSVMRKNFGQLNVSASGLKEAIVFNLQTFWQVQFKYIPESLLISTWEPLIDWMVQQRELEFTPDVTSPNTFYAGTLEDPNQGLQLNFQEMLPNFPFNYQTPLMKFRVRN